MNFGYLIFDKTCLYLVLHCFSANILYVHCKFVVINTIWYSFLKRYIPVTNQNGRFRAHERQCL